VYFGDRLFYSEYMLNYLYNNVFMINEIPFYALKLYFKKK